MKKWIFLIAVGALIYYQMHKPVWQDFVSQPGAFSVLVPGKPNEQVQKQFVGPAYGGTVDMHNFIVEQGGTGYLISYTDAPSSASFARAIKGREEDILDGARDGAVEKSGGKLTSEAQIMLGKHLGREIKIEGVRSGVKYTAYWRIYLIGTQIYQLGVVIPKEAAAKSETVRFFDSFKLI